MKGKKIKPFVPYISPNANAAELTVRSFILGIILCVFFCVANAYLGLKTGTTISASIPAAIISMTILRFFFKRVSILENNIVQTIATVGEGLATGIIFTIPALILLGDEPSIFKIFLISILGGILGILFMIPLRRHVIVQEHNTLPFPEGKACAEILKAGESKNHQAAIFAGWGLLTSMTYKILMSIFFFFKETPRINLSFLKNTPFSMEVTPALLGVGYIIGNRISALMFAGGLVSWVIIIPLIKFFGGSDVIIFPSNIPISFMSADDIWSEYVRYIGAGAVAWGGFLGLFRILPKLFKTVHLGLMELVQGWKQKNEILRTEKDISIHWMIIGPVFIMIVLWITPTFSLNLFTIILLTILAFFFTAVTSITVGIVGSTSNPSSGMTLATLLITCVIFSFFGWTDRIYLIAAITMSAIANTAISMAATTSQDLKTGFLIGATPKAQQLVEIFAVIVPSLILGFVLYFLHQAYGLGSSALPAPQATLMALLAKAIISKQLPFLLVAIGVLLGIIATIVKMPVLPFAIGLYLPLSLTSATMVGGIIHFFHMKDKSFKKTHERAMLLSSGFIGGDAIIGILAACLTTWGLIPPEKAELFPYWVSFLMYAGLALFLFWMTIGKWRKKTA